MPETELKIRVLGNEVLRHAAEPIKKISATHGKLLSRMAQLMYSLSGIGLAAPQVGISQAMIVVDIGKGLYKLINPKIIKSSGIWEMEEGCLSVPGIGVKVKRAKCVTLEALDENGKKIIIEAEELLACVFQHELDHLKGKLIIDYASEAEKNKICNKLVDL